MLPLRAKTERGVFFSHAPVPLRIFVSPIQDDRDFANLGLLCNKLKGRPIVVQCNRMHQIVIMLKF
uniref:Uncharacterized protein n=1 Tax=Candidatus Kentrum sp. TUN TaxID=2126343 RepID=A0A450ZMS4_9GAMM|nr:MAG: hypothetical protein BECKTUN1418F_GA0071002_10621 [Candidatus Kentron sp. TUN]VFK56850.1 MAG: hypothetical protein BECKTUN1418D_GA0071000_10541 [Candidatus Kentron sp. TUN]VFK60896.1 MAG: hypothetical protein BECKTUN1418E_GA0071001_10601 [Candidatus Kentron sp. TUN]